MKIKACLTKRSLEKRMTTVISLLDLQKVAYQIQVAVEVSPK